MRLPFLLLFLSVRVIYAQSNDELLAAQYFASKEYQKAADIYEDLARKSPESLYYYDNLLQCYILVSDYKSAYKLLDKRIKKYQYQYAYQVDKAWLYHLQGLTSERDQIFNQLLKLKLPNEDEVDVLANAFLKRRFYDQAVQTYLNARDYLNDKYAFIGQLSDLYFQSGKKREATQELIHISLFDPLALDDIKNKIVIYYKEPSDYNILSEVLLLDLQKDPDNSVSNDLLIWAFCQQKDWNGALIQAKAVDKRLKDDGKRVFDLCNVFIDNEAYDLAVNGFTYVRDLGDNKRYYYYAQSGILQCGMLRLRNSNSVQLSETVALEKEYLNFLYNRENYETVSEMNELAEIYIFYLNQVDKGIEVLNRALKIPGVSPSQMAECKLQLGDALLISGDPWEADLIYKQVEKAFTNDALGQEARFRYARLCYFRGDFQWAQTQLDVLKGATTQLISNNAMRLWLIIQDNTGLDSTEEALKKYAKADMLIFQNKMDEAMLLLDSIPKLFPGHSLMDEILFSKALISEKRGNYQEAERYYLMVTTNFSYDILADNALFNLARLYEFNLNDTAKAKRMYELLILNYTGSLYAAEARKRFRLLRGDAINEPEYSN